MKVYFATDHAGYELKNELVAFVRDELGYEVEDCGAHEYDALDDYPDFINVAAQKVSANRDTAKGIIIGHSGNGEAMAANRFKGVRAAVYYGAQPEIISLSRDHNNANMLSLGAGFIDNATIKETIKTWLTTDFSEDERHVRRINKIDAA